MDKSRNYILDRLKSKKVSIEEFDFDRLQAPPLAYFFSPFDIQELHSIATSIKYAAKPQVRYDAIDKVCRRRGLIKFAAGTNRVIYRHPEFPDYLFKIAADDIGLGDNPAEYRNQFILKPFVAKTFEISPCGTVAIVEKVNPIQSREEFLSVADDVFTLLTEWIIGEYVVADCGSSYFMNFGVRSTFGIVLLDYPYVYPLDGNKLFCRKPDPTSQSGFCDGIIDYDAGYNKLRCTKCGAIYRAQELSQKIHDKELIVKRKGEKSMNIKIKGGTASTAEKVINTNEEVENVNFSATKLTTKSGMKINIGAKAEEKKPVEKKVAKKEEPKKIGPKPDEKVEMPEVNKSVNGVPTQKKKAKSVVSFSEEVKEEAVAEKKEVPAKSPVEVIEDCMKTIVDSIDSIEIESVKKDITLRALDAILSTMPDMDKFDKLAHELHALFEDIDADLFEEAIVNDELIDMVERAYDTTIIVTDVETANDNVKVSYNLVSYVAGSEVNTVAFSVDGQELNIPIDGLFEVVDDAEEVTTDNEVESEVAEEAAEENTTADGSYYDGMVFYDAETIDVKELFSNEDPMKVIVVKNGDDYLTIDHKIVAVDILDNKSINNSTLVSNTWMKNAEDIINSLGQEEVDDEEDVVEEEVSEEEDTIEDYESSTPANGMTTEEFLAAEEASLHAAEEAAESSEEE